MGWPFLLAVTVFPYLAVVVALIAAWKIEKRWRVTVMAPLLALPLGYLLWFHFAFEPTRTGFEALALPAVVGFTWLLIHEILMFVSAPQGYYTFSKRLDYGHWGLVVASIVLAAFPFLI